MFSVSPPRVREARREQLQDVLISLRIAGWRWCAPPHSDKHRGRRMVIKVEYGGALLTRMKSGRDPSSAGRFHSPPCTGSTSTSTSNANWSTVLIGWKAGAPPPAVARGEVRYCARRSADVAASP